VSTSTSFGVGTASAAPTLAAGVFDHVSASGRHHGGAWTGGTIGSPPAGFGPNGQGARLEGFQQVGGRFTVTGSGDIAPFVAGAGSGAGPTGTIEYILGIAPGVLPSSAGEWLLRLTPAAAFAIQQTSPVYPQVAGSYGPPDYFPLAPWAGFAVLCGYAMLALGLAVVLLRRRDA